MHPQLFQSLLTLVASLSLLVYVLRRPRRETTHWLMAGLMGGVVVWTAGVTTLRLAGSPELVRLGLNIAYLGVFSVPPGWFLLAAHQNRFSFFEARPGLAVLVWMPSAMSVMAALTNPAHRLFVADPRVGVELAGGAAVAGPLFWAAAGWGYLLVLAGSFLYASTGLQMLSRRDRARGAALTLASFAPLVVSVLHFFSLLPVDYDLTPAVIGLSVLTIFATHWRFQVLDTLPVARRDVIEQLADAVAVVDGEGRLLDLNQAARELLDLESARDDVDLAERVEALLADTPDPPILRTLDAVLEDGGVRQRELDTREGRRLELRAGPVCDPEGRPIGASLLLRDRSDQRRAEEFLRRSQRLETVASLAAGIAHEVNNPLAFVRANLGHVQRLAESLGQASSGADPEKSAELDELRSVGDECLEGVERIAQVIERLQRFARVRVEELGEVDPERVVREALRMARLHWSRAIEVDLDLEPGLPALRGCQDLLVQALLNLLINASQATEGQPEPRVGLSARRHGLWVEIEVHDNGPGIPRRLRERVFDPFFTTRRAGDATGLGLPISFDLVREQGGSLSLVEDEEDGARFRIRLPLQAF